MFNLCSVNGRYLTLEEMTEAFYPVGEFPWVRIEDLVEVQRLPDNSFGVPRNSWLGLWNLLNFDDYQRAFRYLVGIGYCHSLSTAFILTNKKTNLKQMGSGVKLRNVIRVGIVGEPHVGKTCLIQSIINEQ